MERILVVKVSDVARNLARAMGESGKGDGSRRAMKKVVHGWPEGEF